MAVGKDSTKPYRPGRPEKEVDEKLIYELAKIHCTMQEISAVTKVSVDTLERRFMDLIKEARDEGRASLRRQQYDLAIKGNVTMLLWLGKQLLGQAEKVEHKQDVKIDTSEKAKEVLDQITDMVKEKNIFQ